jgi:hypothetical protein
MHDFLLLYFIISTAAVPAAALPRQAVMGTKSRSRPTVVYVKERFARESLCQQRVEAVRGVAAVTSIPSEKFELACHPVPRGASTVGMTK